MMRRTETLWNERFGQWPPQRFLGGPAQDPFGCPVPIDDHALFVDRDERVVGRLEDQPSVLSGCLLDITWLTALHATSTAPRDDLSRDGCTLRQGASVGTATDAARGPGWPGVTRELACRGRDVRSAQGR